MTTSVGEQIRQRRLGLGLSQANLSGRAGLTSNYVCRLESGEFLEPSYKKITAIEAVLNDLEANGVDVDGSSSSRENHQ